MSDIITLGGNIELEGFSVLEPAEILIVKKLVGGYVRKVCDQYTECKRAHFLLIKEHMQYHVTVSVDTENTHMSEKSQGTNVFMTVDEAIKKILKKLKIEDV